jgi:hypothetical protein
MMEGVGGGCSVPPNFNDEPMDPQFDQSTQNYNPNGSPPPHNQFNTATLIALIFGISKHFVLDIQGTFAQKIVLSSCGTTSCSYFDIASQTATQEIQSDFGKYA